MSNLSSSRFCQIAGETLGEILPSEGYGGRIEMYPDPLGIGVRYIHPSQRHATRVFVHPHNYEPKELFREIRDWITEEVGNSGLELEDKK